MAVINKEYDTTTNGQFVLNNYFTKEQKELLLELICNKQIDMILKNNNNYMNEEYRDLEQLKVKIKDM